MTWGTVDSVVRGRVLELLGDGPMALDALVAALDREGLLATWRDDGVADDELADAVINETVVTDEIWVDGRLSVLARADLLTDGMVLTHRLTADELERGEVRACPDLVILDWDARDGLVLDGMPDSEVERSYGALIPGEDLSVFTGPDGWLDGLAAGDLVAFTRTGSSVRVERVDDADRDASAAEGPDEVEVSLLRDAVAVRLDPGAGEEAVPLVLDALTARPEAFRRPVRPLGELLEAAGLERRGFSFGRAGEAWSTLGDRVRTADRKRAANRWGLGWCCQDALGRVDGAFAEFDPAKPPDRAKARTLAADLAHDMVANAFVDGAHALDPTDRERREAFATWIVGAAPGQAAGAQLVLGSCAELRGDGAAAEDAFRAALRTDPDYGPAAVELAQYELDRGHLDRAITLLRHPDLGERHPIVSVLERLRAEVQDRFRGVGRNDPCPCGSGRRFKVCCLRDPKPVPSVTRAMLELKLKLFCGRDQRRSRLVGLASSACDPDAPDLADQIRAAVADPFILDLAVYEGGFGEDYLDERGSLLPPAERRLLEAAVGESRRLWVADHRDDEGAVTLRSAASGDMVGPLISSGLEGVDVGDHVVARVAEVDGAHQVVGRPVRVPLAGVDPAVELLAGHHDADLLAEWWGEHVWSARGGEPAPDGGASPVP